MSTMIEPRFGLYLVLTDPSVGYERAMEAAVFCGVRLVQLRMKQNDNKTILEMAKTLRRISSGSETKLIVNDSVRIAAEAEADGVHLGQGDESIETARRFWNTEGKIFGLSTHSLAQAHGAISQTPDYIGVGPVFATPTKAIPDPVLGLSQLFAITASSPLVTVPIGGVDCDNLNDVLRHGSGNYAVVRAVGQSSQPVAAIRALQQIAEEFSGELSSTSV